MLQLYSFFSTMSTPFLSQMLQSRARNGKEIPARLDERKGKSQKQRPDGPLIWLHAASVGEAQSALILVNRLVDLHETIHVLVTTGTVSSTKLMEDVLPNRAFHQFYPLDHPRWVKRFLDHWQPDLVLWMESELWPNMLHEMRKRHMHAALINARLSDSSYRKWYMLKSSAKHLLKTFSLILTQSEKEEEHFRSLGADVVITTDNLKYSAAPLPFNENDFQIFTNLLAGRPTWVFASTHDGEEKLAAAVHQRLKENLPDLLTIIVPRHPERRGDIQRQLEESDLNVVFRGFDKTLPDLGTDIYVADTLGELGLFYRVCSVACIGRSFSDDGGGGHNPIEAAQLHCAVLHGPNVQFQQDIYDEMSIEGAAYRLRDEGELNSTLFLLFSHEGDLKEAQNLAYKFAQNKGAVVETVMESLDPLIETHIFRAKRKAS